MNKEVSDKQKNAAAIMVMQRVLEIYSEQNDITIESALMDFSSTLVYNALFDFDTGLWREGPEYILSLFKGEMDKKGDNV